MLIFQIKRTILVKNGLTTSYFFCCENTKNLGRLDDAKRREKRGWPNSLLESLIKKRTETGNIYRQETRANESNCVDHLYKMTEVKGQPSFTTHNTIYILFYYLMPRRIRLVP